MSSVSNYIAVNSPIGHNMTHKERVLAVFNGMVPDRAPIYEQAFASSVASQILGRPALTGSTSLHYEESLAWVKGESCHAEFEQRVYEDAVAITKALDLDIIFLPWRLTERPTRQLDEYTFLYGSEEQGRWCIRRFDPISQTFGEVDSSARRMTVEELRNELRAFIRRAERSDIPLSEEDLSHMLRRLSREYGDEYAIPGEGGMAIPLITSWLELTLIDRGLIEEYLDIVTEGVIRSFEAQKKIGVDFINGGGDFADNHGPIYSPKFFREVMAPRWKRIIDHCKRVGLFYIFRSDGNLWPVADILFGWVKPDAYGEVDWEAGMDFAKLRESFPDLVLCGNVPTGTIMINGTPQDVEKAICYCIDSAAPRILCGTSNAILHGTPVENVYALFDTAREYSARRYGSFRSQDT